MTDKQAETRTLAAMLRNDKSMFIDEVATQYEAAANLLERLHARVVELEEINQQLSEQYDTAANCAKELQSQLEAIGAGGVESLRTAKRAHGIQEPT